MPRRGYWFLASTALLFATSGACALVYEVVWFKLFSQLWGSSAIAMAAVVACYLAGIGLGSWWGGNRAPRVRSALSTYARLELALASIALVWPDLLRATASSAAQLTQAASDSPLALTALRLGWTLLWLAPPCALMGATLPMLVECFSRAGRPLGGAVSWLYAANTLGGACGAGAAGFFLLPELGLTATNRLAALTNLLLAALAWGLVRRADRWALPPSPQPALQGGGASRARAARLAGLAVASGWAALSLQVTWSRQAALLLGGSTYTYAAVVAVFLGGLGLGSLAARVGFALGWSAELVLSMGGLVTTVGSALGLASLEPMAAIAGDLRAWRAEAWSNGCLSGVTCAVLLGPATIGMGLFLPALLALRGGGAREVGRIVAWNTLGAVLGAACAAALLLPRLGLHTLQLCAMSVYALGPWLVHAVRETAPPHPADDRRGLRTALGLVALAALVWRFPVSAPLPLNLGQYWYGSEARAASAASTVKFYEEGATANVLVLEAPASPAARQAAATPARLLHVRTNGKIDAGNHVDMPTQLGLAYAARLFHPAAGNAYLIGMGSGTTAGASLLFSGTQLTVAEIEPAVVRAARCFVDFNHDPFSDPDLRLVYDDGRAWLAGSDALFDLILSEPTNPWIAGVSNLFTREFYQSVRRHLRPGGVFVQWFQLYGFTPDDYARAAGTLLEFFGDALLLRVGPGDTLLVASTGRLRFEEAELDAAQARFDATPAARADLERYFQTTDLRSFLFRTVVLDRRGLERLAARGGRLEPVTDANLRLEFDTPLALFQDDSSMRQRVLQSIQSQIDGQLHAQWVLAWGSRPGILEAIKQKKSEWFSVGLASAAHALVELARVAAPDDSELLVDDLLFSSTIDAATFDAAVERLATSAPLEAYRLGKLLSQRGQHARARRVFEALTAAEPESATAWTSLGIVLASLGEEALAQVAQAKASELDPINELTREIQREHELESR